MHVTFPVRLAAWCAVLSLLVLMALTLHVATAPVLAVLCAGCAAPLFWRAPKPSLAGVPRWFLLALAPFLVYGLVNTLAPGGALAVAGGGASGGESPRRTPPISRHWPDDLDSDH